MRRGVRDARRDAARPVGWVVACDRAVFAVREEMRNRVASVAADTHSGRAGRAPQHTKNAGSSAQTLSRVSVWDIGSLPGGAPLCRMTCG